MSTARFYDKDKIDSLLSDKLDTSGVAEWALAGMSAPDATTIDDGEKFIDADGAYGGYVIDKDTPWSYEYLSGMTGAVRDEHRLTWPYNGMQMWGCALGTVLPDYAGAENSESSTELRYEIDTGAHIGADVVVRAYRSKERRVLGYLSGNSDYIEDENGNRISADRSYRRSGEEVTFDTPWAYVCNGVARSEEEMVPTGGALVWCDQYGASEPGTSGAAWRVSSDYSTVVSWDASDKAVSYEYVNLDPDIDWASVNETVTVRATRGGSVVGTLALQSDIADWARAGSAAPVTETHVSSMITEATGYAVSTLEGAL